MLSVTCIAPVNIAVIKYWGKRDEDLVLPHNDSISGTLSMNELRSKTTIAASDTFKKDRFWLNTVRSPIALGSRLHTVIEAVRELAKKHNPNNAVGNKHIHICSENNFPTAAGLASSAAGYACLVYTLASLFGIEHLDLTPIARLGSGSACRSLSGGFVHWMKGVEDDGRDSIAVQVACAQHWPEMRVLIVVINEAKKKMSSTAGMAVTVQNSELYKRRIEFCVDQRIAELKIAVAEKSFERFARVTMKDSNQFHAVCLDSYPPIVYMNDVSHRISQMVHQYNDYMKETRVAYTFDAGPNACLYMLEKDVSGFVSMMNFVFPNDDAHELTYIRGLPLKYKSHPTKGLYGVTEQQPRNLLRYIIYTKIGEGPKRVTDTAHEKASLLDDKGLPLPLQIVMPSHLATHNAGCPKNILNRKGSKHTRVKTEPRDADGDSQKPCQSSITVKMEPVEFLKPAPKPAPKDETTEPMAKRRSSNNNDNAMNAKPMNALKTATNPQTSESPSMSGGVTEVEIILPSAIVLLKSDEEIAEITVSASIEPSDPAVRIDDRNATANVLPN